MTGGGILGTVARVVGYMIVISLVVAAFVTIGVLLFQNQNPGGMSETLRNAMNRVSNFGGGRVLGGMSPDAVPPPNLSRIIAAPASQNVVTGTQEVIMVGESGNNGCLGGDKEMVVEIKNDIGADQLDLSFSSEVGGLQARVVKVASCGNGSTIKQCIPISTADRAIRLQATAYYFGEETVGPNAKEDISAFREEKRVYPVLLDKSKREFLVSEFIITPDVA